MGSGTCDRRHHRADPTLLRPPSPSRGAGLDVKELALGLLLSGSVTFLAAWSISRPAPPVEQVIEYRCPPPQETHLTLQDIYFEIDHLTSLAHKEVPR
jgi:hypothetical protein